MSYYLKFWENYFNFSGRSQRAEYWIVQLIHWPFSILLMATDIPALSIILAIIGLIPGLALTFRRLHDTGRSAWWLLILLIPLIGIIWFFILMCLDSQKEKNKYGINPKI